MRKKRAPFATCICTQRKPKKNAFFLYLNIHGQRGLVNNPVRRVEEDIATALPVRLHVDGQRLVIALRGQVDDLLVQMRGEVEHAAPGGVGVEDLDEKPLVPGQVQRVDAGLLARLDLHLLLQVHVLHLQPVGQVIVQDQRRE